MGHSFPSKEQTSFISWLQSPSALILESKQLKSVTVSTFPPSICHEVVEPKAMILVLLMLSFKSAFSHSSISPSLALSPSSRGSLLVLHFRVISPVCLRLLIFRLGILIPACDLSSPAFCIMYSAPGHPWWLSDEESTCQC